MYGNRAYLIAMALLDASITEDQTVIRVNDTHRSGMKRLTVWLLTVGRERVVVPVEWEEC